MAVAVSVLLHIKSPGRDGGQLIQKSPTNVKNDYQKPYHLLIISYYSNG